MTSSMSDEAVFDALREADPLAAEPVRASSETEMALARLLARDRDAAVPVASRSARRRRPMRVATVTATVLGVAVVITVAVASRSGRAAHQVSAARARVVLARAADVLTGAHGAILEADVSSTQKWSDGHSETWGEQDWQQLARPFDDRSITTHVWPTPVEMATVHGAQWLYDPATNTIYTADPTPEFTLTAGARPGDFTLHVGNRTRGVTATQAAKLRRGVDVWAVGGGPREKLIIIPRPKIGSQLLSSVRQAALKLLRAPGSTVTTGVTVDGRRAIQITSADRHATYDVTPGSLTPIQAQQRNPDLPGNLPSTTTSTFTGWRTLRGTSANLALLSLTAQHPSATVNPSAAGYRAAENRLFR